MQWNKKIVTPLEEDMQSLGIIDEVKPNPNNPWEVAALKQYKGRKTSIGNPNSIVGKFVAKKKAKELARLDKEKQKELEKKAKKERPRPATKKDYQIQAKDFVDQWKREIIAKFKESGYWETQMAVDTVDALNNALGMGKGSYDDGVYKLYNADSLVGAIDQVLAKQPWMKPFKEDLDEKMDYSLKMRDFETNREFNDPKNWVGLIEDAIKKKAERIRIKKEAEKSNLEPAQVYMMMFRKAKLSLAEQKRYARLLYEKGVTFSEYQFREVRTWKFNTKEGEEFPNGASGDQGWVGKGAIVKGPSGAETAEARATNLMEFFRDIRKVSFVEKVLAANYITDGMVGFVSGKDGNAYELIMRPAVYGKFKNLYPKLFNKEEEE
jgi:hypothetical protein